MVRTALIALIVGVALSAGCGAGEEAPRSDGAIEDSTGEAAAVGEASGSTAKPVGKGKVVKVVDSQFGRVLADGKGEAYYLFDRERSERSECYRECAAVWPPVLTKGRPRAGKGAKAAKLGTTRRRNGRLQVTYAAHPLYYYVDDAPGTILCQNVDEFGGLWLVVKPSGAPVR